MQLIEGLNVADRFRLVRELGRGGMGSVWLAEHTSLDVLCAIKFIDREGQNSPDVRLRFQREAKAAAQLRSPHVVQILDHGVWENVPFIAMEYMDGEDLAHRLDRVGRLSWGETSRITTHVARALTKAHAAGIVHRDMKPENVFLARDDDGEVAKVLDFGIAKRANTALTDVGTKTGSLLGTPFYMSPEQARGTKSVDHRSDLFSLAVIVYQCLTGELPFYSEGLGDILAQIMYEPIPVPSQKAPDLPPTFDAWWARASAREPEARFQSAKELAEALAVALRLSDTLDIPTLAPRAQAMSSPELTGSGSVPKLRASNNGPTLALSATTDKPVVRTFEPETTARKKGVLFAATGIAVVVVGAGLFLLRGAMNAPAATNNQIVVAAPSSPAIDPVYPTVMPPVDSVETITPGALPHASATAGPSGAPHHPKLPPAPRPVPSPAPGKRDYGI